ncbi:LRC66 protein, partial [Erpornis zantholeuca]|nr:LRC66 protein [Erpornis zantholeuca]
SECRWDGQFLLNCSFTRISTIPEDISQAAVTADLSYNSIKTFMCSDGRKEQWMLKHLNLSNNRISELNLTTCTNLPILETLNLSGNAIHTLTLDMPTPAHGSKKYSTADCLLPALKVLSVERNNLNTVPRGGHVMINKNTAIPSESDKDKLFAPTQGHESSIFCPFMVLNNSLAYRKPISHNDFVLSVVDLRENALTISLPQILVSLNFFQFEVYLSKNAW